MIWTLALAFGMDVLSGRRLVRIFCATFCSGGPAQPFCQENVCQDILVKHFPIPPIHLFYYSAIFWAYLGHIFDISLAYLWHILGIPRAYLEHVLGIFSGYLGDILGIFLGYLGHILSIFLVYEKVSDVPESRLWFASKNLTPRRMH